MQRDKRAPTGSLSILDQFAESRGERTWQTPITQEGLDALCRVLRKTARKNTAVACHWIRSLNHSELIRVVVNRWRFNAQGAVPTNTAQHNVLRSNDENDWHTGELIRLLVDFSGLLHDLEKAIEAFQIRLSGAPPCRNLIRHGWVSLQLFGAFVGENDDDTWLARLASPTPTDDARRQDHLRKDKQDGTLDSPFKNMHRAPPAQTLGSLVVAHHRLPVLLPGTMFQMPMLRGLLNHMQPAWNEWAFESADPLALKPYWNFHDGLPVATDNWHQRAGRKARRLIAFDTPPRSGEAAKEVLKKPFVMHLSRLSLMLADHHYSSLENTESDLSKRVKITSGNTLLATAPAMVAQPTKRWTSTCWAWLSTEPKSPAFCQAFPSICQALVKANTSNSASPTNVFVGRTSQQHRPRPCTITRCSKTHSSSTWLQPVVEKPRPMHA